MLALAFQGMTDLFNALPARVLRGDVDTPHVVEAVGAIKAAENVHETAPHKASMRRTGCLGRDERRGEREKKRGGGTSEW